MRIETWVGEKSDTSNNYSTSGMKAHYYLEPVQNISATEVEFRLLLGPGSSLPGGPINPNGLPNTTWYAKHNDYRFFLRGSQDRWAIARMWYDETAGMQMVVLRTDH